MKQFNGRVVLLPAKSLPCTFYATLRVSVDVYVMERLKIYSVSVSDYQLGAGEKQKCT